MSVQGLVAPARTLPPTAEIVRFVIAGGINTAVDLLIFNLLTFTVGVNPVLAKVISTTVAVVVSFLLNRHWTFRHRQMHRKRTSYTRFALLNTIGLGIAEASLWVVVGPLGAHGVLAVNIGNAVGTGAATVFRFVAYRKWVFPETLPTMPLPSAPPSS